MKLYSQLSPSDKEQIKAGQKYRCALCFCETEDLVIDHDHETDAVRQALCSKCNVGLGMFGDDWDHLLRAVCYVLVHKAGLSDIRIGLRILVEDAKKRVEKWDEKMKQEANKQLCQAKRELLENPLAHAEEITHTVEPVAPETSTSSVSEASKSE